MKFVHLLILISLISNCSSPKNSNGKTYLPAAAAALMLSQPSVSVSYQCSGTSVKTESSVRSPESENFTVNSEDADSTDLKSHGREKGTGLKWPNRTVYYQIDAALPDPARVYNAIAHWQENTKIIFTPKSSESNFVTFRKGTSCTSSLGMVGGEQFINLSDDCYSGIVVHEIGHAVGLAHEHNRMDRNSFILILPENIQSGQEQNFTQSSARYFSNYGLYDFGSVMHYHSWTFSKNGKPAITKKNGETFYAQRKCLSLGDTAGVADLYGY